MPSRVRLFFSIFSVVLLLIAAAPLYRELFWPLATLIEAGQVRLTDERGSSVLTPDQIGLRFNLVATGRLTYRDDQEIPSSSGLHPRSRG